MVANCFDFGLLEKLSSRSLADSKQIFIDVSSPVTVKRGAANFTLNLNDLRDQAVCPGTGLLLLSQRKKTLDYVAELSENDWSLQNLVNGWTVILASC